MAGTTRLELATSVAAEQRSVSVEFHSRSGIQIQHRLAERCLCKVGRKELFVGLQKPACIFQ